MRKKQAKKLGIIQPRNENYRTMAVANKSVVFVDKKHKKEKYKKDYRDTANWQYLLFCKIFVDNACSKLYNSIVNETR